MAEKPKGDSFVHTVVHTNISWSVSFMQLESGQITIVQQTPDKAFCPTVGLSVTY